MATRDQYDLILMDIQMPEMDGFTATGILRETGMQTPIIALTANAMKGFEQQCLDGGYSGYFTKPIDIDKFVAAIAGVLGAEASTEPASEQSLLPTPTNLGVESPPVISTLADDPRFDHLIIRFKERLAAQLALMDAAWSDQNLDALAKLGHWLKGAGGTVGFVQFTEPAKELEFAAKASDSETIVIRLAELHALSQRIVTGEAAGQANKPFEESDHRESMSIAPIVGQHPPIVSRLAGNPRLHSAIGKFVIRLQQQYQAMQSAWSLGDLNEIAKLAHWLKGAGGTVGYDAFTEPSMELEQLSKAGRHEATGKVIENIGVMVAAVQQPVTELAGDPSEQVQMTGNLR